MKRLGIALFYAVCGYFAAAALGYFLIAAFSPNAHDRDLEAAMTGAFVTGPVGALASFVFGFVRGGRGSA